MSWQDNLATGLKITTGDNRVYTPLSVVGSNTGSFEFNISEFTFPEVSGTKVDRRLPKGTRYPLEFYFQGEDNIEQFKQFIESSRDVRPWTILHPVYGQFIAHPLSIEFDNSGINTTKINVTCVETITDAGPRVSNDLSGTTQSTINKSRESNMAFGAGVQPTVKNVNQMKSDSTKLYNEAAPALKDEVTASQYFNLFNKAQSKINSALNDFNTGITFIQDFIVYPAQFAIDLKLRFQILKAQALKLSASLDQFNDPASKQIFESQKGSLISATVEATLLPISTDYQSAVDVLFIIGELIDMYNTFISELQTLQTPDGTQTDSYLPDAQFMYDLNYSVNYAVSNLFNIALSAQQERIFYLDSDSNVIIEAHRYYGLNPDDSNIQKFINTNNIQITELLQIKKGRKLVYYV